MSADPLEPYRPTRGDPFDVPKAGHLLRRAALGGSWFERQLAVQRGPEGAVDALFADGPGEDVDCVAEHAVADGEIETLRAYRFWRLVRGKARLRERMSLFWHGHFATSQIKVQDVVAMSCQLRLFDDLGLGRFERLLQAVGEDPAMLRWLDADRSVKGRPNENYARELFELFGLGRGAYTEQDVQEAARAFTGYRVEDGRCRLVDRHHDGGAKTVLGATGAWTGADVSALVASHPASARFLARKLLAGFVHPIPSDAEVAALAALWIELRGDVGAVMRRLLTSRMFYAPRAIRSRIADPVELVVGTVRMLGANAPARRLAAVATRLGQTLLEPPSVAGWPHGAEWITSATWLLRQNFAAELFAGRAGLRPGAEELLGPRGPTERVARAVELLHDGVLSGTSRDALAAFVSGALTSGSCSASTILHAVKVLPEGQLW